MTIQEYIAGQDEAIRPRLTEIYDTIRAAIPQAEERLSWGMPTFWKGRNIIHFAPAKRLTAFKTSKGAIQLPHDRELPLVLLAEMAAWCYAHYAK